MTDTATDAKRESMQAKIAKLLAKAESTDSEHEAENLRAKAFELMADWGVSAAMIDAGRTQAEREKVTESSMEFHGGYAKTMVEFGHLIAEALGIKPLIAHRRYEKSRTLLLIGHKSDVERARILITSLQLQANTALRAWWKGYEPREWMSPSEKTLARRQFLRSFAGSAHKRLLAAAAEAERAEQERQNAAAPTGSATSSQESGPSVALVLADRKAEVRQFIAQKYPNIGHARASRGSHHGRAEGAAAGQRADLGDKSRVGGGARAALA